MQTRHSKKLPKTNSRLQLSPGTEKLTKTPSFLQRSAQVTNQMPPDDRLSLHKIVAVSTVHRGRKQEHRDLQQKVQRLAQVMDRFYTSKNDHTLSSRTTSHQIINERNLPLSPQDSCKFHRAQTTRTSAESWSRECEKQRAQVVMNPKRTASIHLPFID
jgi:hypothetical protein